MYQGSVISPLLFIIVVEAISRIFKSGCPHELLYADDLAIIASTEEELVRRLKMSEGRVRMAKGKNGSFLN